MAGILQDVECKNYFIKCCHFKTIILGGVVILGLKKVNKLIIDR